MASLMLFGGIGISFFLIRVIVSTILRALKSMTRAPRRKRGQDMRANSTSTRQISERKHCIFHNSQEIIRHKYNANSGTGVQHELPCGNEVMSNALLFPSKD